jgi:hypothetical protein
VIWRVGLAASALVLAALAVAGILDPAIALVIVVLDSMLTVVALVVYVASRRRLLRALGEIKTAAPVVVPDPILMPPDDVAAIIATVRGMGFELAGVTETTLLGRTIRAWIMTRPAGDIWAEVGVTAAPKAIFLSQARTGRFLETGYPFGSQIDVPELLAGPVGSSAADALATQQGRLAAAGGPGRSVVTIDDYLDAEQAQRASNGGLRIRQHLDREVRPSIRDYSIALVVDAIALGVLLAVAPSSGG